jgi:hypothetical protein
VDSLLGLPVIRMKTITRLSILSLIFVFLCSLKIIKIMILVDKDNLINYGLLLRISTYQPTNYQPTLFHDQHGQT